MDFTLDPATEALRRRVRDFVSARLIPLEAEAGIWGEGENIREDRLRALRDEARGLGLWAPQTPVADGGMGLSRVAMAAIYEEAGRCRFGPAVLNCAAPDDGNMMLLAKVGTAAQKSRWLAPIVAGSVRSSFAMTEPHPGGGSDPSMIQTRA
jgi:acyl-CoA dehydrogenase